MKVISPSQIKTKSLLSVLVWFSMFSTPFSSYAMECSSDVECGEGEYCELILVPSADPCFIDEEGNEVCEEDSTETEEVLGFCEERPIECMEDSDCPSHLSCEWAGMSSSGSSAGSAGSSGSSSGSSGSSGSGSSGDFESVPPEMDAEAMPESEVEEAPSEDLPAEPDQQRPEPSDESMMCVFVPSSCEEDNDCAMNFHCEISTLMVDCAVPEVICDEGEDCEEFAPVDCGEEEYTEGHCMPDTIECDNDAACPSDWHCREQVEFSCDSDDIAIGAPEPAQDREREAEPNEEPEDVSVSDCEETVRSLCMPIGLDGAYGFSEVSSTNNDGDRTEPRPGDNRPELDNDNDQSGDGSVDGDAFDESSSNSDVVEDEGGCDAHSNQQSSWMLIFSLALLACRRRLA